MADVDDEEVCVWSLKAGDIVVIWCVWPSERCYTNTLFPEAVLMLRVCVGVCEAAQRSSLLLQEPGRGHASYALLPYFLIFKGWRRPGRILCHPQRWSSVDVGGGGGGGVGGEWITCMLTCVWQQHHEENQLFCPLGELMNRKKRRRVRHASLDTHTHRVSPRIYFCFSTEWAWHVFIWTLVFAWSRNGFHREKENVGSVCGVGGTHERIANLDLRRRKRVSYWCSLVTFSAGSMAYALGFTFAAITSVYIC